jgi:EmrB/QacA subfamily drug resistance transporter
MNGLVSGKSYRWVVLGIVIMGTFMAILDSSIVNVALPHMMSAFGVNREQIQWVSTSYMISLAVTMTTVGWTVKRVGNKVFYLGALTLFVIGSAACAFAWSFDAMIVSRVLQAVGGGAIQPVGMAIIAELFEPHERGKALGIWGAGVMLGPAIGPTLGGYLCDWFNWRTIFSINLPFGLITVLAGMIIFVNDFKKHRDDTPFDFKGFLFLAVGLIGALIALANGEDKGWTSGYILTCFALAFAGITLFIAAELDSPHPLFNIGLLRFRNYTLALLLGVSRAVGLFGGVFLLPIFLENISGYTTIQTGLLMMPGAVVLGIAMPFLGHLSDKYGPKWLVTIGVIITGSSLLYYGKLDPSMSRMMIIAPQIIRAIGLGLMMAPLMTAAVNAVPKNQIATASSFLNIAQSVGGAFGIAILNAFVTRLIHFHAVRIGEQAGTMQQIYSRLGHSAASAAANHTAGMSGSQAASQISSLISIKASVLGFENGFMIAGFIVLATIPLSLMLKNTRHHKKMTKD